MADDLTARLVAALESINSRLGDNPQSALLADALQRLAEVQKEIGAASDKTQRQIHRPTNENPPLISAYNPRGDKDFPRPLLKCDVFIFGGKVEAGSLTREEIELLNLLTQGEYSVRMTDGSRVTLQVVAVATLDHPDVYSRLTISHETAFNQDNYRRVPPLADLIREMVRKKNPKAAADVLTMEEERTLVEAGELAISVGA